MPAHGLTVGTPEIGSAGPIAFGPDDVLFVADNTRATILAVDVADPAPTATTSAPFDLEDLDSKLAAFLGSPQSDVSIRDLAVHPRTHNPYLAVTRGSGDQAISLLVRVDRTDGSLAEVPLDGVAFAEVAIDDAPAGDDPRFDFQLGDGPEGHRYDLPDGRTLFVNQIPARASTVTDLAYVDGQVLVAGMSNEEFASTLRRIPFPFDGSASVESNSLEIFHVSHGMWETASPIRTFVPYEGGRSILASYTCTPLVHIPVAELAGGTQVRGRTVAELGAGNQPLDMVSFHSGDDEYLLVCHSNHPLMKIACRDVDSQEALTTPQAPVGTPFEKPSLDGITRLAVLDAEHILTLQSDDAGSRHLRSVKTASL